MKLTMQKYQVCLKVFIFIWFCLFYRARDKDTGQICALKKLKLEQEQSGFPLTSIREINILLALEHPSIVNVSEIVMGPKTPDPRKDMVFMVMEYADHDLKAVMDKRMKTPFSIAEVKCLMLQLLSGIAYLHEHWVLHRDLKTSNILYTNKGQLKICDFGLARQYSSFPKQYTQLVVTLWYRAPELLLGAKNYSTAIDMWSVGCIMGELLSKSPLFTGHSEIPQMDQIFKTLGYPNEEIWPGMLRAETYCSYYRICFYKKIIMLISRCLGAPRVQKNEDQRAFSWYIATKISTTWSSL